MAADEKKSAEQLTEAKRQKSMNESHKGFSSRQLPIPMSGRIARALLEHIRNEPELKREFVRNCMRNERLRERILKWAEECGRRPPDP